MVNKHAPDELQSSRDIFKIRTHFSEKATFARIVHTSRRSRHVQESYALLREVVRPPSSRIAPQIVRNNTTESPRVLLLIRGPYQLGLRDWPTRRPPAYAQLEQFVHRTTVKPPRCDSRSATTWPWRTGAAPTPCARGRRVGLSGE